MRPCAVRNEQGIRRILRQLRLDDLAMREIHRARYVAAREQRWTANIQQYESRRAASQRLGNIPAIRFELQRRAEVHSRGGAVGGGNGSDGINRFGGLHGHYPVMCVQRALILGPSRAAARVA